jgi:histidinol-phosphatase
MPTTAEYASRLQLAMDAAREAGRITLEYFNHDGLEVERKDDNSPVTIADRRAEEYLRRRIAEAFPDDAIHGEEFSDKPGASGFRWLLDPIDGTKSFIYGVPLYTTLVAVEHEDESVLGVIELPALNERLYAATGQGAWHVVGDQPPRPARVSSCPRLADGLFVTSAVATYDRIGRRDAYDRLQAAASVTRSWGDGYGYYLVATGRALVMVDPMMNLWDAGPLLPILQEAGGTFTDWNGNPTTRGGCGVATNGEVLDEVMGLLGRR